jgi:hypothetical protein
MTGAIEQRTVGRPPSRPSADSAVRQGHYALVARLVRDFEIASERITDLDEIPLDLLSRFARALNRAERAALARTNTLEEATD